MILAKTFVGKRTATVTNTKLPKTPPNATRVDNLIVNQMREQARVRPLNLWLPCCHLQMNLVTAALLCSDIWISSSQ